MSRSSKGFADFFPTAPSVLQQKKSRSTQERSHHDSSSHPSTSNSRRDQAPTSHHGTTRQSSDSASRSLKHGDKSPGDVRNGIGSTSSTSTISTIFDTRKARSSEHTPLSHVDSASPVYGKSPSQQLRQENGSNSLKQQDVESESKTQTFQSRQARPGKGQVKGVKTKYDPEMDRTISSKEKRQRKPVYEDILSDVSSDLFPRIISRLT